MNLRVLHITRTPKTVEAFLKPIIAEQRTRGHEVELAFGNEYPAPDGLDVPVHRYPVRRSLSPVVLVSAIKTLAGTMRSGRYDVIVAHMALGGLVGRVAFALAHRPGRMLYASHGLPCYPACPRLRRTLALVLERILRRWTDGMIVLNGHDYSLATKYKLGGNDGTVHFLKSVGIDRTAIRRRVEEIDIDDYRTNIGVAAGLPMVCYAGRFIKAKGAQLFVQIARRYITSGKQANFMIAGSGPLDKYLRCYIARNGLGGHVKMLGWYDDIIGLLAASDVLCFPTLYEGAPVIVQEAMAVGTVVLSSRVPGPEDLVDNDVTGVLVEAGDVDEFCAALENLLEDRGKRLALSQGAMEKSAEFDLSSCVAAWVDAIEAVASEVGQS